MRGVYITTALSVNLPHSASHAMNAETREWEKIGQIFDCYNFQSVLPPYYCGTYQFIYFSHILVVWMPIIYVWNSDSFGCFFYFGLVSISNRFDWNTLKCPNRKLMKFIKVNKILFCPLKMDSHVQEFCWCCCLSCGLFIVSWFHG